MPTYFDGNFDQSEEVSDLHNLTPVFQNEVNAVRSNYPYGEVTNPTSTYQDCMLGTNSIGQTVYEMRDSFKGNAARAIMYHAVKNNTATDDFSLPEQISLVIQYGQNEYTRVN
jgi:endonuclease I